MVNIMVNTMVNIMVNTMVNITTLSKTHCMPYAHLSTVFTTASCGISRSSPKPTLSTLSVPPYNTYFPTVLKLLITLAT